MIYSPIAASYKTSISLVTVTEKTRRHRTACTQRMQQATVRILKLLSTKVYRNMKWAKMQWFQQWTLRQFAACVHVNTTHVIENIICPARKTNKQKKNLLKTEKFPAEIRLNSLILVLLTEKTQKLHVNVGHRLSLKLHQACGALHNFASAACRFVWLQWCQYQSRSSETHVSYWKRYDDTCDFRTVRPKEASACSLTRLDGRARCILSACKRGQQAETQRHEMEEPFHWDKNWNHN